MSKSLKDTVIEPSGTKGAIHLAMLSAKGMETVWIVVEAEEDVAVYEKFVQTDTTTVKTSEDTEGRKGYGNVELIVREIKNEKPKAHIIGIRDADYTRYNEEYSVPENVFLTDNRDLEMMLLKAESVKERLRSILSDYDNIFERCVPICRYFGYLRIYNEVQNLSVMLNDHIIPSKYWDYTKQSVKDDWEQKSTDKFVSLSEGACSGTDIAEFISSRSLEDEDLYDVCRGHDFLRLLSLSMVDVQTFSEKRIMNSMIVSYSYDDFKKTKLYSGIIEWQAKEGVNVLSIVN